MTTFEREFPTPQTATFRVRLSRLDGPRGAEGIIVILTDITERRRAQAEINRLATIVDSSEDAIFSISLEGRFQSLNHGAERIYGLRAPEALGHSIFDVLPDGMDGEMHYILEEISNSRPVPRYETLRRHASGQIFPVSVTYSPIVCNNAVTAMSAISRDISERKRTENALRKSHQDMAVLLNETVKSLSMTLEKRDLYTAGHQQKVSQIACLLAHELGMDAAETEAIRIAGLLHDIGKICVPMAILSKPARLVCGELNIIQNHPTVGLEILKNIPFPWPVGTIIHQHHERLDGSGYPKGLSGADIHPGARVIAVADVLEAMSAHRPYRPALGLDVALREFSEGRGSIYDPHVCDALEALVGSNRISFKNGELVVCQ
nr:HD domain-containing phosphohydrolase [Desulfobaculum xiamenense]